MNSKLRGSWGEACAAGFLRDKGYKPVAMGYRTRFGEIDIIAEHKGYIVFVEVKLRKNADFAEAKEFVTKSKQEKIKTCAEIWLSLHETALQPRFDVIEIYAPLGEKTENPRIQHLVDAF